MTPRRDQTTPPTTIDLGLAIGTGTDVAIETSDLTLVSGDLRAAADGIRLSRATLRLSWAFGYSVAGLCFAWPFSNGDTRTRTGDTTISVVLPERSSSGYLQVVSPDPGSQTRPS